MIITILGIDYTLPDSLADITVQKQMDWSQQRGGYLFTEKARIDQLEADLPLRTQAEDNTAADPAIQAQYDTVFLERTLLFMDTAKFAIMFFAEIPEDLIDNVTYTDLLYAYSASQVCQAVEQTPVDIDPTYNFSGTVWEISPPFQGKAPADFTEPEAKALIKIGAAMRTMGRGDWAAACVVLSAYFRHVGEDYDPAWLVPGNARYDLMLTLTMDMALPVFTYLADTMSLYLSDVSEYLRYATGEIDGGA